MTWSQLVAEYASSQLKKIGYTNITEGIAIVDYTE